MYVRLRFPTWALFAALSGILIVGCAPKPLPQLVIKSVVRPCPPEPLLVNCPPLPPPPYSPRTTALRWIEIETIHTACAGALQAWEDAHAGCVKTTSQTPKE